MRILLSAFVIGALALLAINVWAFRARAHGEYAWINDGHYKSANGTHCCGVNDCVLLSVQDVKPGAGGYSTPHGVVPHRGTYNSRDGKIWMCRWWLADPGERCLFIPGAG